MNNTSRREWCVAIGVLALLYIVVNSDYERPVSPREAGTPSPRAPITSRRPDPPYADNYAEREEPISRDEAISLFWDDICEYVNGTDTLEACDLSNSNCYDLDAEISSCSCTTEIDAKLSKEINTMASYQYIYVVDRVECDDGSRRMRPCGYPRPNISAQFPHKRSSS